MALMRAVGASVSIAEKAGAVLRDTMAGAKEGVVYFSLPKSKCNDISKTDAALIFDNL